MTGERREFLAEVAWLHHEHHLTQDEIGRRFDVSRSTVSRALAEAERLGIVQVVVTVPIRREARLAAQLSAHLGVPTTVGIRVGDETPTVVAARAAARVVERIAEAGDVTIAVSWGRTLAATVRLVRRRDTSGVKVVDAVGHPGGDVLIPAVDVTQSLASALDAAVIHLPSPAFVPRGPSADALMASDAVRRALDIARSADVTLVSVGVVGEASLLRGAGAVDAPTMAGLIEAGAAGEILGCWFDRSGIDMMAADVRAVGLSLEDLRASRRVVAVAGGIEKADAVSAALAGRIIHELVIDDLLAEALVDRPAVVAPAAATAVPA